MVVRGQPQVMVTLRQEKDSQYLLNSSSGGQQSRFGIFGEGKNIVPCRNGNTITTPTQLSCLRMAQDGDGRSFRRELLRKGNHID